MLQVRNMDTDRLGQSVSEQAPNRPRFRAPWAIFWVGFGLRVAVILIGHTYKIRTDQANFNFGFEAGRIARSLVRGQGYANPFNGLSGPTAWLPPLYPLLIAAAFKVFGVYTRAAWLWAAYPAALQYAIHWIWEMSLTVCLFSWAIVVALRLRRVGEHPGVERRLGLWAGLGVLWGLIALSNASLLLCLPAMAVWVAWPDLCALVREHAWVGLRDVLPGVVLLCLAFALVLTPWVVRNERTLHAFVPTRSNFGIELYNSSLVSNDGLPWGTAMPLWEGDRVFQMYERMGEIRFAHMRQEQAKANLRAHPGLFVRWTIGRFFFFWDGTPHPPDRHPVQEYLRQLSYSFLSVCGLLGLGLMLRRRVPGAGLFALCFALVPLVYYAVTVQPRFRHPLEPLTAILAVYLFRSTEPRRGPRTNS